MHSHSMLHEGMVILPGGMYARVNDIYIEDRKSEMGEHQSIYGIPLKAVLERYHSLETEYERLKMENIRLKQFLYKARKGAAPA